MTTTYMNPFQKTDLTEEINLASNVVSAPDIFAMFAPKFLNTTFFRIIIDDKGEWLNLVPSTERGAPPATTDGNQRTMKFHGVPHFPLTRQVNAEDIQNRITNDGMQYTTFDQAVADATRDLNLDLSATRLFMIVRSLTGKVIDHNGNVLIDLHDFLGVTPKVIDFDLDNTAAVVRLKCLEASRYLDVNLRGDTMSGKKVLCSPAFFDKLIEHPSVKSIYDGWQASADRNGSDPRTNFPFAGLNFVEFNGKVSGTSTTFDYIPEGEAYLYPLGTNRTFSINYAPPVLDGLNRVNKPASEFYAMMTPDPDRNAFMKIHAEMNALPFCRNPRVLVKLTA